MSLIKYKEYFKSLDRKDWCGVSLKICLMLILPFLGTFFVLFTIFIPITDMMKDMIPILADEKTVVDIRDMMLEKGHNISTTFVYYMLTVGGAPVLIALLVIFVMGRLLALGNWMSDKIVIREFVKDK